MPNIYICVKALGTKVILSKGGEGKVFTLILGIE